jgi:hypothetical protein
MASSLQGALVVPRVPAASRYRLLDKYFYFAMSLLIAAIVVAGFSRTVNQNLFHPAVPRPFLLWIHAAAFTLWIVFFILQSALVRVRKVKWHRLLGWFGAGLAAVMVPLGFTIAIVMGRFDKHIMHVADANTFLSIPFGDMAIFSFLSASPSTGAGSLNCTAGSCSLAHAGCSMRPSAVSTISSTTASSFSPWTQSSFSASRAIFL